MSFLLRCGLLTAPFLFACGSGGAGAEPGGTTDAEGSTDAGPPDALPAAPAEPKPEFEWLALPARSFTMGSDEGTPLGEPDEAPAHTVALAAFELTATEITVGQYTACVRAGACTRADTHSGCNYKVPGRLKHPINCVDWDQAQAFAAWIGEGARLPTEAEWEFAARSGGRDRLYPWGDEAPTCERAVMAELAPGCGEDGTAAVCSKPAGNSLQGACDLSGNVWEWAEDWYHEDYVGAPRDGRAFLDPPGTHRVLRGGAWAYDASNQRARRRGVVVAHGRDANVGFRLAR